MLGITRRAMVAALPASLVSLLTALNGEAGTRKKRRRARRRKRFKRREVKRCRRSTPQNATCYEQMLRCCNEFRKPYPWMQYCTCLEATDCARCGDR